MFTKALYIVVPSLGIHSFCCLAILLYEYNNFIFYLFIKDVWIVSNFLTIINSAGIAILMCSLQNVLMPLYLVYTYILSI